MGIIFDLDQTLIDSIAALELRNKRAWSNVYGLIPQLKPYEGVNELIKYLHDNDIPICIVTNSPSSYCKKIIEYWNWNISNSVCYHDVIKRKPNPESMLKAIGKMNTTKEDTIAIGDDPKDIIAAKEAGIVSIAALWGTYNEKGLINSNPDFICKNVKELEELIKSRFINIQHNI